MKTQTVPGLEIKVPKATAFAYETEPMMLKSHQVSVVCGKRGSGKTLATVNLMNRMKYDRVFVVSPSVHSNRAMMDMLKIDPEDVYDVDDLDSIDDIKAKIDAERDDYERYHEDMKKYREFMKKIHSDDSIFSLDEDALMSFYRNGKFQKPVHKWNGRRPHMAILFDDAMGSQLFTKGVRKLSKLAIYSRHLGQLKDGGALGVSLYFLCQSWKAQVGGLTKAIRSQATSLIVFKTANEKELADIQESCGGEVSKNTFYEIYNKATDGEHNFLLIDLHWKKGIHPSPYRKNLNEFIITQDFLKH